MLPKYSVNVLSHGSDFGCACQNLKLIVFVATRFLKQVVADTTTPGTLWQGGATMPTQRALYVDILILSRYNCKFRVFSYNYIKPES